MEFYKKLLTKLQDNQNVYLLTVVENIGSSPGRQGFKMFVSQDGFISGSIGGGIMEYQFVEKVKRDLKVEKLEILFKRQIHQGKGKKDSSGMICSGEQTVVFHPLNKKDIPTIKKIIKSFVTNKEGFLTLSPNGVNFKEKRSETRFDFTKTSNKDWLYKEQLNYKEKVYIIGAGHVGLAISKLLDTLNFNVVLFDDRDNLNTFNENDFVMKKQVIDYKNTTDLVEQNTYVIIMTTKFTSDKLVLSKLIQSNKKFKYLGVLGSKAKIKTMFEMMLSDGILKLDLDNIYAPIGLSIKSQTPEEIAVSIVAQIIEVKNALL
ncbi:MAG TPA: XdhC/CoxI family protein [Crocinitomix sp.]|nr:XdhC/CoxI family protein [Crocinitomix sp.]